MSLDLLQIITTPLSYMPTNISTPLSYYPENLFEISIFYQGILLDQSNYITGYSFYKEFVPTYNAKTSIVELKIMVEESKDPFKLLEELEKIDAIQIKFYDKTGKILSNKTYSARWISTEFNGDHRNNNYLCNTSKFKIV